MNILKFLFFGVVVYFIRKTYLAYQELKSREEEKNKKNLRDKGTIEAEYKIIN